MLKAFKVTVLLSTTEMRSYDCFNSDGNFCYNEVLTEARMPYFIAIYCCCFYFWVHNSFTLPYS